MQNLIFGAFAALEGYREGDAANLGRAVYDRCTVVALCSAKLANPACTVALVTNAPPQEPYRSQLTNAGIEIWDCPFTSYRVPADTNWALAYYKLCAMEWVLANKDFANAAMLDLDTYTQHPLDDLWRECGEAVLMYQVPHAASQGMTAAIGKAYDAVEPQGAPNTLTNCRPLAWRRGRATNLSGAGPPTAACWPGSPCVPPTPTCSATGWADVSTLFPPTTHWTPCAFCICPVPPKTASWPCCTAAMPRRAASRRWRKSTGSAACPPPIRRCCAPCGCGCWPACKENFPCQKRRTCPSGWRPSSKR